MLKAFAALILVICFAAPSFAKPKPRAKTKRPRVSSCLSAGYCRGSVIYTAPQGEGINLQECHSNGGRSIRGEFGQCANLVVNEPEAPAKPQRRSINLGETCYDMECDCVNGLTTYVTKRCGDY